MSGAPNCPTRMEMYLHDSSAMLRFVLRGELARDSVYQLECAWVTATSILGARSHVVDVSGLTQVDTAGSELLARMVEFGARLVPMPPPDDLEQPVKTAARRGTWIRDLRHAVIGGQFRRLLRQLTGRGPAGPMEAWSSAGKSNAPSTLRVRRKQCGLYGDFRD